MIFVKLLLSSLFSWCTLAIDTNSTLGITNAPFFVSPANTSSLGPIPFSPANTTSFQATENQQAIINLGLEVLLNRVLTPGQGDPEAATSSDAINTLIQKGITNSTVIDLSAAELETWLSSPPDRVSKGFRQQALTVLENCDMFAADEARVATADSMVHFVRLGILKDRHVQPILYHVLGLTWTAKLLKSTNTEGDILTIFAVARAEALRSFADSQASAIAKIRSNAALSGGFKPGTIASVPQLRDCPVSSMVEMAAWTVSPIYSLILLLAGATSLFTLCTTAA